ncbi:MucBP domain-containing protein [Liquorilactobacillus cacaonum]|uniref:MucBP domain-containing protein n=1 Tax=Liquorilactobacillus cacaonum DSM 21116 TaxID=1423729 RepID=A0A0R2CUJ2_9LACO|nr:MucBP domain-containing protein [Liquorilactobacillus cacaonum]KRM91899.1 hypothetical protein FC80_GL000077 [Liquorilactobacillus cacaonum DSM 21116]
MKIPKFIKNLLLYDSKRKYAHTKKQKNNETLVTNKHISPQLESFPKTPSEAPQTKKEFQDAILLILYVDDKENELTSPQIISGHLGEKINYRIKTIENFDLINFKGFTKTYSSPYAILKLTFAKKISGSIWTFTRDIDTNELLESPKLSKGYLGDAYQLYSPTISEYSLVNVTGLIRGIRSLETSTVTFFYRRQTWLTYETSCIYLKMLSTVFVYDFPDGKQINIKLSPQTIWKTFRTITTSADFTWYCIGGSMWVCFDESQMSIFKKPDTIDSLDIKDKDSISNLENHTNATIDYIEGRSVNLYDFPFGKISSSISHGVMVQTKQRYISDEVTWYKLASGLWIPEQYLIF